MATPTLPVYESAHFAHSISSSQCDRDTDLPFSALEVERPHHQQTLMALVYANLQKVVTSATITPRLQLFRGCRASMALPEAKSWAHCLQRTKLPTNIRDSEFRTWLQFYCQFQLFSGSARYPGPNCDTTVHKHGDVLLFCERGAHRRWRYDSQLQLLAGDLVEAAKHTVIGDFHIGTQHERPDNCALGTHGGANRLMELFLIRLPLEDLTLVHVH